MDDFELEFKLETLEEVSDHLEGLQSCLTSSQELMSWSKDIDEIFRIFHSIKGNTKAAGMHQLSDITHLFENFLLEVKNENFQYSNDALDLLYRYQHEASECVDVLRKDLASIFSFDDVQGSLEEFLSSAQVQEVSEEGPEVLGNTCAVSNISNEHINDQDRVSEGLPAEHNFTQSEPSDFLIIDDEADIVEILKDHLEGEGFGAADFKICAEEGLDLCRSHKYKFIITDYSMPKVNGEKFIQEIRYGNHLNSETPIIMITGHRPDWVADDQTWRRVFFLEKPVNYENLSYIVKCCLALNSRDKLSA